MKHNKKELDAMIDGVARDIRDEPIDPSLINESATRVWEMVSQQAVNSYSEGINTMKPTTFPTTLKLLRNQDQNDLRY